MADYVKCSAKEKQGRFGPVLLLGFKAEVLRELANQANERGYVNLAITARKEVGAYGDTHSVKLDTFTPKQRDESPAWNGPTDTDDSIPF